MKAETLDNRKNMRQIFCYKPGNGVLLQSRLCNYAGGTRREQAESADWMYEDFCAKVSILADHENDYKPFEIGTYGLCISCGCEISERLYCYECGDTHICDRCGGHYSEEELYTIHDSDGDLYEVCEFCGDRYYSYCDCCDSWVRGVDAYEGVVQFTSQEV